MYREIEIGSSLEGLKAYEFPCEDPKKIVCLIHGIGEYFLRYERVAGRFNEKGIDVIGMDLRGHGDTPGKKGHCAPREAVLKDVDCLIKYAQEHYPGIPIVLYGHSMGGNIVLDYRARGNLNGVPEKYVVSAPWVQLVRSTPKPLISVLSAIAKVAPKATMSSSVDEKLLGNPESVGSYSDNPMVHNKISLQTAVEGFTIGNRISEGTWPSFGEGHLRPMLLLHGDIDGICDVRGSRNVAEHEKEHCKYIELEDICHEIHNGGPNSNGDEVIELIANWITGDDDGTEQ